ncbi:MAG TPA: phosphopantetheine-binding protein [Gammaproteobacteria bacterium]|nr:phosphopantetheine-binding protein [Gammaproteobacteria bacterium]
MRDKTPLEQEVARLVIDAVGLEDVSADEVDPEAPLFREGLGLDSIDALEIALSVSREYGIQLRADNKDNGAIFASLENLAAYIENHRPAP